MVGKQAQKLKIFPTKRLIVGGPANGDHTNQTLVENDWGGHDCLHVDLLHYVSESPGKPRVIVFEIALARSSHPSTHPLAQFDHPLRIWLFEAEGDASAQTTICLIPFENHAGLAVGQRTGPLDC